eukprot:scaffold2324_cov266-Pinguiococcus_pyrenoidosus.AAC.15
MLGKTSTWSTASAVLTTSGCTSVPGTSGAENRNSKVDASCFAKLAICTSPFGPQVSTQSRRSADSRVLNELLGVLRVGKTPQRTLVAATGSAPHKRTPVSSSSSQALGRENISKDCGARQSKEAKSRGEPPRIRCARLNENGGKARSPREYTGIASSRRICAAHEQKESYVKPITSTRGRPHASSLPRFKKVIVAIAFHARIAHRTSSRAPPQLHDSDSAAALNASDWPTVGRLRVGVGASSHGVPVGHHTGAGDLSVPFRSLHGRPGTFCATLASILLPKTVRAARRSCAKGYRGNAAEMEARKIAGSPPEAARTSTIALNADS